MTGMLPCGLLIPAYIGASSMSGKMNVAISIALFFAGTLPALLMSKSILSMIRKKLPQSAQTWINPSLAIIFLLVQVWMFASH